MRLLAALIGLIVCAQLFAEATTTDSTESLVPVPDYTDWFQVEIIIFALKNPPPSDEVWTENQVWYPNRMLDIASDEDLKPRTLSQLKALLDDEALLTAGVQDSDSMTPDSGFLSDRPREYSQYPVTELQQPTDEAVDDGASNDRASDDGDTAVMEEVDLGAILDPGYPRAFEVVPTSERFLSRIAGSVNRSSRYRMLLYTSWRQPIVATDDNWPILIQAGERFGDRYEVDGTLTVSRARFLHVEADLWFTQFAEKYEQEMPLPAIVNEFDPAILRAHKDLVEVERNRGNYIPIQSHQMQLSRRMRSATLHFLDDPYFGVLIQIDNFVYETPDAAAE